MTYAVLFSCSAVMAEDNIVIGMPSFNFSSLPIEVAEVKGFYKRHGLKVQRVLMRSDVGTAALISGDVQYVSGFNNLIRATVNGFDTRVTFSTASKQQFSLVVQPEIRKVGDLKGKIVGTNGFGAFQYAVTVRVLKAEGVTDKDVQWIVANDAVFRQQMKAKKMHAALISPPLSVMMQKEGFGLLVHAADYVDAPLGGLGTTAKSLKENPDQSRRMMRAMYEALQFVRTDREETMEIASRWLKMDPAIAASTYDLVLRTFSPDGTVSDQGLMNSIEIAKEGSRITKAFSPSDVADFSIIRAVIKEYEKKGR